MAELNKQQAQHKDQLFLFYERWHNTPYRLGGQSYVEWIVPRSCK
ncbi:hypothetical protein JCM19232_2664 [Vibrio ishigakensis]|uniref:Uncharacterized protein n=1 Tax=Vibrio ishigakensis TaxID=1481914 RepID=A0A0B8PLW3_9VIBR|nr:hypothetical protein JCM19232_2664 [Vibrio ishigakensis]